MTKYEVKMKKNIRVIPKNIHSNPLRETYPKSDLFNKAF